jgi:hypothetical protein
LRDRKLEAFICNDAFKEEVMQIKRHFLVYLVLFAALFLSILSCSNPSNVDFTGTWKGEITIPSGPTAGTWTNLIIVVVQNDTIIENASTWSWTDTTASQTYIGNLSGTVSGSSVTLSLTQTNPPATNMM